MRLATILLFASLIIAESLANAQQFKVLKDTVDYKLMEVDSGYFYSHGIENKNEFIIDTTDIKKKDGLLSLFLLNGIVKVFKDTLAADTFNFARAVHLYNGENKKLKLYLIHDERSEFFGYVLIDESNGEEEWLNNVPYFSSSYSYFGYNFFDPYSDPMSGGVYFEDIKTKKSVRIELENRNADHFKWIDDNKFLYTSIVSGSFDNNDLVYKYFLVEIKK